VERSSDKPHVLIVGGGPAGLETLIGLRELVGDRVSIELVATNPEFEYRPLAVAEPFGTTATRRYDLPAIAAAHHASFVTGTVERVDARERRAWLSGRQGELGFDILVVAVGGRPQTPLPEAVTILSREYTARFRTVLRELERRRIRSVAFVVPSGVAWPLPLYELALMTAGRVAEKGLRKVQLNLVTHEDEPLGIFGREAASSVRDMLEERHVRLHTACYPAAIGDGEMTLTPASAGPVPAARVVTLPVLSGPRIGGLPHDAQGFIPVDPHGLVAGETDIYAAGDATTFPIKQGGIATQEADAVAEAIAARVGAELEPQPFRPVLRGMLLTGDTPQYMRAEISGGRGEDWDVSEHALWWPPSKIAGRYLSPYLGLHHREIERGGEAGGGIPIELELEQESPQGFPRKAIIVPGSGSGDTIEVSPED
jgi:sulfide:quinone oxidoreductase